MVLFVGIGVVGMFLLLPNIKLLKSSFFACLCLLAIFFGYGNYHESTMFFNDKTSGSSRTSYVKASSIIAKNEEGQDGCAIWSAAARPELSWYARCRTFSIGDRDTFKRDFLINFRKAHYSVVFSKLKDKQLDENVAKEFGISLSEVFRTKAAQSDGDLVVYKIDDRDKFRFESSIEKE